MDLIEVEWSSGSRQFCTIVDLDDCLVEEFELTTFNFSADEPVSEPVGEVLRVMESGPDAPLCEVEDVKITAVRSVQIPERFHPQALKAGLSQLDLPCGDPACGAEPGEACGPFCTHGDAGAPGRGDLVPVSHGEFAVRGCPRCGGSGQDASSPDRTDCRCRLSSREALELYAGDLHQRARTEELQCDRARADRTRALARRIEAHTVAAALRERKVAAHVQEEPPGVYLVGIETRFGRITASLEPDDAGRFQVHRVDGTRWALVMHSRDVDWVAATLCESIPELAFDGDRLVWLVAPIPTNGNGRTVLTFVGHSPEPGERCRICLLENRIGDCPGIQAHFLEYRSPWLDFGGQLVSGAFPMPVDLPENDMERSKAIAAAIATTALKVWTGALVIT